MGQFPNAVTDRKLGADAYVHPGTATGMNRSEAQAGSAGHETRFQVYFDSIGAVPYTNPEVAQCTSTACLNEAGFRFGKNQFLEPVL